MNMRYTCMIHYLRYGHITFLWLAILNIYIFFCLLTMMSSLDLFVETKWLTNIIAYLFSRPLDMMPEGFAQFGSWFLFISLPVYAILHVIIISTLIEEAIYLINNIIKVFRKALHL